MRHGPRPCRVHDRLSFATGGLLAPPRPGRRLPARGRRMDCRYEVSNVIGSGGMATVHLGIARASGGFARVVAIKRLRDELTKEADLVHMLAREAKLTGRIRHPNVSAVLDVVCGPAGVLVVMEYVHGAPLSMLVRQGPVPARIAVAILIDALQGLHAAHELVDERGAPLELVHRDVSPQNIMVGADGITKVVDFGIAKARQETQVTAPGTIKGKLAYIAPEQL